MNNFQFTMDSWQIDLEELYKAYERLHEDVNDPQRKKLSYYIMKELVGQCQEICDISRDLARDMEEIETYIGSNNEKLKRLKR